jgi:predicted TIM-barrel fold metal-dependent hydrolase
MMMIDSHTHVDLVEAWGWMDPPETIISLMDEANIEKSIIMTYRDAIAPDDPATMYIHQAIQKYPHRLIGYVRINPNAPQASEALDQAILDLKFKGLKLHPVSYVGFPYAPPTIKLMQRAAHYQAPVLFHTGDESLALPEQVAEAARQCPNAQVILAHLGGYYHYDAAIQAGKEISNILIDTSAIPYPWMVRKAIDTLGVERVLFASDGPGCLPKLEVEKILLAGLSSEEQEMVFFKNIQRIMEGVKHVI